MIIDEIKTKIRDLAAGYTNDADGAYSMNGKLNIRPQFQREFVYNEKQQMAVIDSVYNGFPLNAIYWVKNGDIYEVLDGQQRICSICNFVDNRSYYDMRIFDSLQKDEQEKILDYELSVYLCEGSETEKIRWFERINIAGEVLTQQEIYNAVFYGKFVTAARKKFSAINGACYKLYGKYLNGSAIRQDYLNTALKWVSKGNIPIYMGEHRNDENADVLWIEFEKIMKWAITTFPNFRKEMKGLDFGDLYNKYKNYTLNPDDLEKQISDLMANDEVENKKGIYEYVLDGNPKHLNLRQFSPSQRTTLYERQLGICPLCGRYFTIDEMHADHIVPWSKGGRTELDNGQMLCAECNLTKSNK